MAADIESNEDNLNWYAVYVKSRHEKKVVEQLQEKEIQHYLPLKKEVRQWSDRKKLVELPLFTGYVFVKIHPSMQVPVLETYGTVAFIKFAGKLVPIREEEIDSVKTVEKYGIGLRQENIDFGLEDRVRVTSGPCRGLEGYIVHQKKSNRFVVIIDSLKLGASVEIEQESLEKVKDN